MPRLPQVNAFVLCDSAFQQAHTFKWCLIGTFGAIMARSFPITHQQMVAFLSLSDFEGDTRIEIQVRRPDSQLLTAVRADIPRIPGPVADFALPFPPVTYPEAGVYTLELHAGTDLLAIRSLRVQAAPPAPPPGTPGAPGPPMPPPTA